MNKTAILLTCFNRKELTIRCLNQVFTLKTKADIYLVDDNSSDGTANAIAEAFPQVVLIHGPGDLFWNRGMHLAWEHAAKKDYDFYIWLNDDVVLYKNCFTELFESYQSTHGNAIISGIIETHDQSRVIYGGYDRQKRLIKPNGTLQKIHSLNGNVVLVPRKVFKTLGNLDPVFHHDLGDVDYGLRAQKQHINVYSTRVAVASGETNEFCRVRAANTSLIKRFKKLYSPLGSNPNITFYFRKKHYGIINASLYYIFVHLLNILPDKLVKILFKNRYL